MKKTKTLLRAWTGFEYLGEDQRTSLKVIHPSFRDCWWHQSLPLGFGHCHSHCLPHQHKTLVLSLSLLVTLETKCGCCHCHRHQASHHQAGLCVTVESLSHCFKVKAWHRGIWLAKSRSCICIFIAGEAANDICCCCCCLHLQILLWRVNIPMLKKWFRSWASNKVRDVYYHYEIRNVILWNENNLEKVMNKFTSEKIFSNTDID